MESINNDIISLSFYIIQYFLIFFIIQYNFGLFPGLRATIYLFDPDFCLPNTATAATMQSFQEKCVYGLFRYI